MANIIPFEEITGVVVVEHHKGDDTFVQTNRVLTHLTMRDNDSFIRDVGNFFNDSSLSDVTLVVGEQRFPCHRFVLAKSSSVFKTMLYSDRWASSNEVTLLERPECEGVFEQFLRFLYTAEVEMCIDSAVGVLCLSDKYDVISLRQLAVQFMVKTCQSPRIEQALAWFNPARSMAVTSLMAQCSRTIAWGAERIFSDQEWLDMDLEFVTELLSSDEVVVQEELVVFRAVSRWLFARPSEMSINATRLLPLVRFAQMVVSALHEVESSELAAHPAVSELLRDLLGAAYRFRALCPERAELGVPDAFTTEDRYQPREYGKLSVDVVKMRNTLRFGMQVDVKMYVGPVPTEKKDGDWKITYRRNGQAWNISVYCHESAMVDGAARFQTTAVVYDDADNVIQVEREPAFTCSRNNPLNMTVEIRDVSAAVTMALLIKPVP